MYLTNVSEIVMEGEMINKKALENNLISSNVKVVENNLVVSFQYDDSVQVVLAEAEEPVWVISGNINYQVCAGYLLELEVIL